MKRNDLIKHIETNGCILLREGGNHSIYVNPKNKKQTAIARHRELDNLMCRKICKQLEIPIL